MSTTFTAIKCLVIKGKLNNKSGFRANDIINADKKLNSGTIRTFLAKHTKNNTIYFERVEVGKYRIKKSHLHIVQKSKTQRRRKKSSSK
jgi:hypothetical protein